MAPEMLLARKYDAKVDLWSVGIILYEALFGKAPYKSDTLDEVLVKIREQRPIVIPRSRGAIHQFSRIILNSDS
jgi:serine/threonine protein kinase